MKRRLTLIAAVLALAVAVGAAVGFIRRRMERLEGGAPAESGNGSAPWPGGVGAQPGSPLAGVNGDRA